MDIFIKNCWYMAAWSDEIDSEPFARRLLDIPVVFFRNTSGSVVALIDRCPHRFAPLSMGKVCGDVIQCGYHGLGFDTKGKCVKSPFGIHIPDHSTIQSFPVIEKNRCVWFWPGDPTAADVTLIPDFSYHDDIEFRLVNGYSKIKANYEICTDNLMDLTHTRYLHPSFGGESWQPEVSFSQKDETVFSHYSLPSYTPTVFSEAFIPSGGRNISETDTIRWNLPGCMYLHISMGIVGAPEIPAAINPSSHILTPETASSTHYFWASAAPTHCGISDEEHYAAVRYAFEEEDAPMLHAVQDRMQGKDFWDLKPVILSYDNAGIRARRIIRQKLRAESLSAQSKEEA
ncbi:aromatic ring-hydroxylating dioxygenase subunit alpha [Acetobacter senegalensis]|uniref:aromatic ring-hydroxylating dioxygenase subunit alpha n=1 Tax=Acetobacter senegalensis TaxID=446692 RepID=UPI001EDC79AD|nr:aromatic ring-hydroxylating dioxygenase subunit alpha [Acetobacter senegalensis]MCG4262442.1 aromatic ring-hydroxylating dioxygenase subunit alpha [Acetobacter senegalensis]